MTIQIIQNLIKQYVESASEHGDGTETGDYKRANRNYLKNEKVFKKLLEFRQNGCKELEALLNHENPHVRLSAATHLLYTKKKEAISVLKKIKKKEKGIVSFSAEMVLKEFKKGNLDFPGFED